MIHVENTQRRVDLLSLISLKVLRESHNLRDLYLGDDDLKEEPNIYLGHQFKGLTMKAIAISPEEFLDALEYRDMTVEKMRRVRLWLGEENILFQQNDWTSIFVDMKLGDHRESDLIWNRLAPCKTPSMLTNRFGTDADPRRTRVELLAVSDRLRAGSPDDERSFFVIDEIEALLQLETIGKGDDAQDGIVANLYIRDEIMDYVILLHRFSTENEFDSIFFFFQAEDGIRDRSPSRGLGDVYKRQTQSTWGNHQLFIKKQLFKQPTDMATKRGRGGQVGAKTKLTLGLNQGAVLNCADNSGAKNLYIISAFGIKGSLNRMPKASVGDMILCSVKKGKPELRKKVLQGVIIRQRKPWRRREGIYIYCEDNAGVIVNQKGEMKGSAINGPVGRECAEIWPKIASAAGSVFQGELFRSAEMKKPITTHTEFAFSLQSGERCFQYLMPILFNCLRTSFVEDPSLVIDIQSLEWD
eukprot:TRINITY_DN3332_c0_g1_i4.p1 TRINITY_DN3332_c0_g1~~TRINITY_DN3332_c0_g1_i4.p1  ORF type:complete len:470 (+),score=77.82 TRINITY_DN3332_c0_g1_i4:467-1876(+)